MSKDLILVQNISLIEKVKKVDKATFLFPLKDYSVGYPVTFSLDEISEFGAYILLNRILDEKSLNNLKELFKNFPKNIKGIVFEDLGVLPLVKDLDITKILWQNHLATNYYTVNTYLNYVDSLMVSTDITYDEIEKIISSSPKKLVLPVYGHIGIMYSRRFLLSNFNTNYNEFEKNPNIITEEVLKEKFIIYENEYGTYLYDNNIYNGSKLYNFDSLYYFINTVFLSDEEVLAFINDKIGILEYNDGFLNKKTIYKLKEGDNK